eukprot:CAMPEP_0168357626 /NCGR_PEP_ID=MMETSP0228-20121227/689_1 /TAXON_ID=133427 /ORGANISM="Protoceratium reticulatum, Strain CCCM 535 (=CCMP 1889)" /LENGTH=179 /DNA_ID=CAMNT_0008370161 /DNA_START=148 /DNA_END=687 /DNA_ORIENTATION=+
MSKKLLLVHILGQVPHADLRGLRRGVPRGEHPQRPLLAPEPAAVQRLHCPPRGLLRLVDRARGPAAVHGREDDLAGLLEVVLQLLPHHSGAEAMHQQLVHEVRCAVQLYPQLLPEELAAVELLLGLPGLVRRLEAHLAVGDVEHGLEEDDGTGLLEVLPDKAGVDVIANPLDVYLAHRQ